ncbi:hypothetical protein TELCIR_06562 [Teladorsagia circumcincta]|uniref:Uncharacterized protein n=1 Tax=Teladorsagia circumcincta TaxID=45464 RepID=A0A2G9UMP9_TELCI|nr:hypothetical protein TELCIR_06562 [Teladorsagia circumcincta]
MWRSRICSRIFTTGKGTSEEEVLLICSQASIRLFHTFINSICFSFLILCFVRLFLEWLNVYNIIFMLHNGFLYFLCFITTNLPWGVSQEAHCERVRTTWFSVPTVIL